MNKDAPKTGKRQRGQTSPRSVNAEHLVMTRLRPSMLGDVNMRKLAMSLPRRQTSGRWFMHLPSPAGLFSQLGPGLRLHVFELASTYSEPFRIHSYRGNGRLAHGPYHTNSLAQVANARALSAVSKAIRHETNALFYKVNSFSINHDSYRAGNDATSVLTRFRATIGQDSFCRIRSIGFISSVSNERASKMLPPPQDLGIQITEALKAMIIAGAKHCLNMQDVSAKIEVCIAIDGHHSYRRLSIGENLTGALEYNTRFRSSIELSLRLPACTWERYLRRWLELIAEAQRDGDEVKERGVREVVAGMVTARERLRMLLPLQSRF